MNRTQQIWTEKINSKSKTPTEHQKILIHDALPLITKASVDVSDFLEFIGDDKLNSQWLKLTGEAQIAVNELIDFIKKNIPKR